MNVFLNKFGVDDVDSANVLLSFCHLDVVDALLPIDVQSLSVEVVCATQCSHFAAVVH